MKIPHKNQKVKISEKANVRETAETMAKVINEESKKQYIHEIAQKLCINKEAPHTSAMLLCNFAFHTATFEPDVEGVQVIKTPAATIRTKRGNCVDYTVLIGAIAKAAGIPVIIKVVAIGDQPEFGHVYPIVNGLSCDVVPYQRQDGKERLFRTGHEVVYPTEKEYNKFILVEI